MKTVLNPDALRVEAFETAEAGVPGPEALARTSLCSAIDLCPTRPC